MLVRGGVEYYLRPVRPEGEVEPPREPDVPYDGREVQPREPLGELEPEVVDGRLGVVVEHEPPHSEPRELPAQLAPYRSRGPGDQHCPAPEHLPDLVGGDPYLLPPEQVLYVDLPHGRCHDPAVYDLVYLRRNEAPDPAVYAVPYEPRLLGPGVGGAGEEHGLHACVLPEVRYAPVVPEVEHPEPRHGVLLGRRSGHEEAHDAVVRRVLEPGDHRHGLLVGAVDEHPLAGPAAEAAPLEGVVGDEHEHADGEQRGERDEHVEHEHGHRPAALERRPGQQRHRQGQQRALAEHGQSQHAHLPEGRVADDQLVGPEQQERRHREQQRPSRPPQLRPGVQDHRGEEYVGEEEYEYGCGHRYDGVYEQDGSRTEEAVQVELFYQSVHNVFRFCTSAERHPAAVPSRHLSEASPAACAVRWRSVPARV